jgi:2-oxoglutarate dehydrogenase E2 component (dihydrolipoamide succinyltransferase)
MREIRVPELGESIVEAVVGRWLKQPGEPVRAGEAVVELETDKVSLEVSAEADGVLQDVRHQAGETVHVGDVLAVVGAAAGAPAVAASAPAPPAAPPSPEPAAAPRATPAVRRLAESMGVDLTQVEGTGPHGRVRRQDVVGQGAPPPTTPAVAAGENAPPAPAGEPAEARREETVPLSMRRRTIARRLVEAQHTAAMLTTFNEIDMSAVLAVRARHREEFERRYGVRLGFMSFFVRATVGALKQFPRLNAEIRGDTMVLKHYYDIGIAVATDAGLVVPVIRDADRLSLAAIERAVADLARRAREGTLTVDDLRGGTFTITNGGVFGSLFSTPILNHPQVGILGMHKVQDRPVAVDGQVVVRPMMYVALSYDHRIVDGAEAVQFLATVKRMLEDPEALLLEA